MRQRNCDIGEHSPPAVSVLKLAVIINVLLFICAAVSSGNNSQHVVFMTARVKPGPYQQ